jgi:hypothetical protein
MGATSKSRIAGLTDVELNGEGFWEASASSDKIDDVANANLGGSSQVFTIGPQGADDGEVAFIFKALVGDYQCGGAVGDLMTFNIQAGGDAELVRGTVLGAGEKTSTANGTARELGAVSATQKLYAAIHVISASGTSPTLDVIVESDDAEAFTDPTTRITFSQKDAIGSEWATPVAGAIADTWWRIGWTIGGSDTPTFNFIVTVGIK